MYFYGVTRQNLIGTLEISHGDHGEQIEEK